MRKSTTVMSGLAVAGLLVFAPVPAEAGGDAQIEVFKEVVGPGPSGPYTIVVDCSSADPFLPFDLADGDSQVIVLGNIVEPVTCNVTETVTQGAQVTYACAAGNAQATCVDSQNITFSPEGTGGITITNTFAEPEPDAQPAAAEAVPAAPTFTG